MARVSLATVLSIHRDYSHDLHAGRNDSLKSCLLGTIVHYY